MVNNAGYGHFGMIEELSEAGRSRSDRDQPVRRAVGHPGRAARSCASAGRGHFLQVSSIGGISAFAGIGMYHASKWALEGISQALAQEVVGLRDPRDPDRARRLLHRLGRPVGAPRRRRWTPTPPVREAGQQRRAGNTPGDPAGIRRGGAADRRRRAAAVATASSARAPLQIAERDYASRASTPGASGSRWPSWRRARPPRRAD